MHRVTAISDQHGCLLQIEETDFLLIAGDIMPLNIQHDMFDSMKWLMGPFTEWLESIPAKWICLTAGNHDMVFQRRPDMVPKFPDNCHLLIDRSISIDGLVVHGSPWQLFFHDWSYNAPHENGEEFLAHKYRLIPDNADIIISHGPPFGHGDLADRHHRTGSQALINRIKAISPKLVITGHIHEAAGVYELENGNKKTTIVNASILNGKYQFVNAPVVFYI